MTTTLEIVQAGAGSGKTTDLCQTVVAAVTAGLDPARILATTFTRKAAAELKSRIQAKLLAAFADDLRRGQTLADRLELAAIGTVHSVPQQLVSKYALRLGVSPRLEILDERGATRAINALAGMTATEDLDRLGEVAERLSVTKLHQLALELLAAKRGNRIDDEPFRRQLAASGERTCRLLADGEPTGVTSPEQFRQVVDDAIARMEAVTQDATKISRETLASLRRLRPDAHVPWKSFVIANNLRPGKKSESCLDDLRRLASQVRQERGLHDDVRTFGEQMAAYVLCLEAAYQQFKAERGLVDFTDLELMFLELLENPALEDDLRSEFQLALVDEFQDTNPLQLAIFQRLRQLAPRNRWVGDGKQAIFRFRGTDAALVEKVCADSADTLQHRLPTNYRSQRGLVQLVGELFRAELGDAACQTSHRPAHPRGVERWLLESSTARDEAAAIARGVAQLNAEGCRYGDIALLGRTHERLKQVAAALDAAGIPYLLESPGLLRTREGALLAAGLRLVADRRDALAAATIIHLTTEAGEPTPRWFEERLAAVRMAAAQQTNADGAGEGPPAAPLPWEHDERLQPLEQIDHRLMPPAVIVQQVIEALDLPRWIARWGDAPRRSANLDGLAELAASYERLGGDLSGATTLTGLITHLAELAREGQDVRKPPQGHDAVTLVTYHAAKGLEWPVVGLMDLGFDREPDMWSPTVTGGLVDLGEPLSGREVRLWVWPFGQHDGPFGKPVKGSGLEVDALNSAEGRAQLLVEQAESRRLLYVGFTRARDKLVLVQRPGNDQWLRALPRVDQLLDPKLSPGEHPLPEIDTTYVVRHLAAGAAPAGAGPAAGQRWFEAREAPPLVAEVDRYHAPSRAVAIDAAPAVELYPLGGEAWFPAGASEGVLQVIGLAVHAYLAALPSLRACGAAYQLRVAERCLAGQGATGLIEAAIVVSAGERLISWVEERFPGAAWHTEAVVTAPRARGGQWLGTIDLLLELVGGELAVIDHKSAPLRVEQAATKAATFGPQLLAYQEALAGMGREVSEAWVLFPLARVAANVVPS